MRLYTWDEDGVRIETDCPYQPYFYSETNTENYDYDFEFEDLKNED